MRALVTGISGFVGGHLTEHLVASGDIVVGISASGRGRLIFRICSKQRIERFDLVKESAASFADLVRRKQPEVIYHLAAQSNPQASVDDPRGRGRSISGGALTCSRRSGSPVKNLVSSSSARVSATAIRPWI